MLEELFFRIFGKAYTSSIFFLGLLGMIFFLLLPIEKRKNPKYYLAFIIVILVPFYEFLGAFFIVNTALNKKIHELFSNTDFLGYNIWVHNIFYFQISKIILILWINQFIENFKFRKINIILSVIFIFTAQVLTMTKIQNITEFQPMIYFMSFVLGIVASGLFFVDLISSDRYLEINPLRFIPFWFITFNLFQQVIVFLAEMSNDYLAFNNIPLYFFFNYISQILYVLMLISIVIIFINRGLFIEKKAKTA